MLRIFIGYDSNVQNIFHVLSSSIIRHSSIPVTIIPLKLNTFKEFYNRKIDAQSSTEFSFSRFLVPYLSNYEGMSIFMDNDMIVTRDIKELADLYNPQYAVQVVKHDYTPKDKIKFLGKEQFNYHRKNWSSVIIFNNTKCKILTPEVVEQQTGAYLHRFQWLDDNLVGTLPLEWNFLVDEYEKPKHLPALLHYTVGGPYFKDYQNCDYAHEWRQEFAYMNSTKEGEASVIELFNQHKKS
jgi:hypothetical protein